jgi:hypothetical protein
MTTEELLCIMAAIVWNGTRGDVRAAVITACEIRDATALGATPCTACCGTGVSCGGPCVACDGMGTVPL